MGGEAVIPHVIRPLQAADEPFLFDCWIREMATDLEVPDDDIERRDFWRAQKPVIARLLKRSTTLVAVTPAEGKIVAWAVAEPPGLLHFVYVRGPLRRGNLCGALMKALEMDAVARASHHTVRGFPRVRRCFEMLELDLLAAGEERE